MSSPLSSTAVGASSSSIFGDCTICLSDLTPSNIYAITKCGHTFHGKCIQKWLKSALSCPTCRTKAYSFNLLKLFFNNDSNDSITNEENSVAEKDSGDTLSVNRENNSRAFEDSSEDERNSDNDSEGSYHLDEHDNSLFVELFNAVNAYGLENDENNSQASENSNEDETDSDNDSEGSDDWFDNDNDGAFFEVLSRINDGLENDENNSQTSYNSSEDETDSDNVSYDNDAVSEALSEVSEALSELRAQIIAFKNHYNSLYSESLE